MRALTGGRYAHAIDSDSFLHLPRVIREECDQYVPYDTIFSIYIFGELSSS